MIYSGLVSVNTACGRHEAMSSHEIQATTIHRSPAHRPSGHCTAAFGSAFLGVPLSSAIQASSFALFDSQFSSVHFFDPGSFRIVATAGTVDSAVPGAPSPPHAKAFSNHCRGPGLTRSLRKVPELALRLHLRAESPCIGSGNRVSAGPLEAMA